MNTRPVIRMLLSALSSGPRSQRIEIKAGLNFISIRFDAQKGRLDEGFAAFGAPSKLPL